MAYFFSFKGGIDMNVETIEDRIEYIENNIAIAYNVNKILQEIDFETQKDIYSKMLIGISTNESNINLIDKLCIAKDLYQVWNSNVYEDCYITQELTKSICSLFSMQVTFAEKEEFNLEERKMKIYWACQNDAADLYHSVNRRMN